MKTDLPNDTDHRRILRRTMGISQGPITRLMSPSDFGQLLKPFVFLDIFDARGPMLGALGQMPIHPHSGIATVTIITEGHSRYSVPAGRSGTIGYGGVEWLKAGKGVWHGKEMTAGDVNRVQGFQLWLALPPEHEIAEPEGLFIEAEDMRQSGPAHIIIGCYENVQSPVPAPEGTNYLLVTLKPGETWTYQPPEGHEIAWTSLATGALNAGEPINRGELVAFENSQAPITFENPGSEDSVFVFGSAIPHSHKLHMGSYSVHTSNEALRIGETHINELAQKMRTNNTQQTDIGTTTVYK